MKLYFKKLGTGEPIIILHGLFGMLDNWQSIANELANNFEVWLVDARNHGHSPHSSEFSYDAMAEDLHQFIQDHSIFEPIIIGHSMGGKTAMRHAQLYSGEIKKLIVVDMGIKKYPVHHHQIIAALQAVPISDLESRKEAEESMKPHISEMGIRQFLLKSLHRNTDGTYNWRFNLNVIAKEIANVSEALPKAKVNLPTLFIRGELSNYIMEQDFADIQRMFPNSEIKSIANAGHWVHAEAPTQVIELIEIFAG
jgi:esterase